MRSSRPIPSSPWPHDMVIEVQDAAHPLLELLWVREAWALSPGDGDAPPLLAVSPRREPDAEAAPEAWSREWLAIWTAAVAHAAAPVDRDLFPALQRTADGSPERRELLGRMIGPTWRDRFGDDALTDGWSAWNARRSEEQVGRMRAVRGLEEQPERIALDALVPAWRAGLTKIVTIPCAGEHTRVIGAHALLVADATRADPDRYRAALARFA
ncbi:hypothetical protein [Microbacterium ulmi]|uniref:Uncharacterized protein n=1 Tax=Microbacterium ulmi TaxID=179095 RepID=A0A7Y2Q2D7_9MICO|nr:hypothetical protein [Microbacterium ulmi]NII70944.1 hypothetical protein [Microbacterium ulmi]NNH05322.1 hypothetical protein [Microbacterium ulmi]